MENNKFKKVRIKNRTYYCFDDIIKLEDFDLDNILIDEKSHENTFIYDISYKTLIDPKPLRIDPKPLRIFDKTDGLIKIYDGPTHLALFHSEKYDTIYDGIRCLISLKSRITYIFSHYAYRKNIDFG